MPSFSREQISEAAAYLDEQKPGWYKKINLDKLCQSSPFSCVLGQLFKVEGASETGYTIGRVALNMPTVYDAFGGGSSTEAWKKEVLNRINKDKANADPIITLETNLRATLAKVESVRKMRDELTEYETLLARTQKNIELTKEQIERVSKELGL